MVVTINDIAQHLNLSVSTVSKALNDYKDVSDETKERVLKAAHELGYHPSAAARSLRRQRTDKIGFLFNYPLTFISEFVSKLITGAMLAAEQQKSNLVLYPASTTERPELLSRICRAREVDGLLVMGTPQVEETAALLAQEEMPSVIVGRRVTNEDASYITVDNRDGARQATRHLVELGHTQIAYTESEQLVQVSAERRRGYQDALEEAGLPLREELIVPIGSGPAAGYPVMDRLIKLPEPPTAVFAIHDGAAISILKAAIERGLRVPGDLAIVGFDDIYSTLVTEPPLTTVHQPLTQIGQLAAEALLQRVVNRNLPPTRQTLPVYLVVRQSTVNG